MIFAAVHSLGWHGEENISGDYNAYGERAQHTAGSRTATLKGDGGTVSPAVRTGDGYTYALSCSEGLEREAVPKIVSGMTPVD